MLFKLKTHLYSIAILSTVFTPIISAESQELQSKASITVTGTREETLRAETAETVGQINKQQVQETKPSHP